MAQRPTLDSLGLAHGTDKSSAEHGYLDFYETFLAPMRDRAVAILEIGILDGASLKVWQDYFPHATIVAADINPETLRHASDRVTVELLDQSNVEQLVRLGARHGPFDLIVEDGSHLWEHQTTTLRTLFPFVRDGGYYIAEDLQTNYGALAERFRGVASESCMAYLKRWADLTVAGTQLDIDQVEDAFLRTYGRAARMLAFHKHACLIGKRLGDRVGAPLLDGTERPGAVAVELFAHLSYLGDRTCGEGFVALGMPLQGIRLETRRDLLQYRVSVDGRWGDWTGSGGFAGSRGQARLLDGVSVRLHPEARDRFVLEVAGRFEGSEEIVLAGDGEACRSPDGSPLVALQVALHAQPAAAPAQDASADRRD